MLKKKRVEILLKLTKIFNLLIHTKRKASLLFTGVSKVFIGNSSAGGCGTVPLELCKTSGVARQPICVGFQRLSGDGPAGYVTLHPSAQSGLVLMSSPRFELKGRVRVFPALLSPKLGHLGISCFAGLNCAGTRHLCVLQKEPLPFPLVGVQNRAAAVSSHHYGLLKTRNRGANQNSPA